MQCQERRECGVGSAFVAQESFLSENAELEGVEARERVLGHSQVVHFQLPAGGEVERKEVKVLPLRSGVFLYFIAVVINNFYFSLWLNAGRNTNTPMPKKTTPHSDCVIAG